MEEKIKDVVLIIIMRVGSGKTVDGLEKSRVNSLLGLAQGRRALDEIHKSSH